MTGSYEDPLVIDFDHESRKARPFEIVFGITRHDGSLEHMLEPNQEWQQVHFEGMFFSFHLEMHERNNLFITGY